jgi:hypothetical protein
LNAVLREYDYLIARAKKAGDTARVKELIAAQTRFIDKMTDPKVAPDTLTD